MSDIIAAIEKAIKDESEERLPDFWETDMHGKKVLSEQETFIQGASLILPLLKKAIENDYAKNTYLQWCKLNGVEPYQETLNVIDLRISQELLKLLGENHE